MEILAILWIAGLIAYFAFTTERQRENFLLVAWIALGGSALVPVIGWLLSSA